MSEETAKELWANRVRMMVGEPEVAHDAGELTDSLPDFYRVTDLPKTDFELAAIDEIMETINLFRGAVCGLPAATFSPERVHVITDEEFRKRISPIRFEGKILLGHVYLRRNANQQMFIAILAHELLHALSYLWLDLRDKARINEDGLKLAKLMIRRAGMVLIDPSYHTLLPHFHGLNEFAAEQGAIAVRQIMAKQTDLLDSKGKLELANFITSPPLLTMFDRLVRIAAQPSQDTVAVQQKLFVDLFTGTDEFLAALEVNLPGATEVLRRTGARPFELLNAAKELGLAKEAELIKQFIK